MTLRTYWNGVSTTNYGYDGRGMIGSIHHVRTAFGLQGNLGYRGYWRDARDRIWAWQRGTDNSLNGKEVGNGTKFQYDAQGQVSDAWYLAQDPGGNMPAEAGQTQPRDSHASRSEAATEPLDTLREIAQGDA